MSEDILMGGLQRRWLIAAAVLLLPCLVQATDLADASLIPHLTQAGRDDYQQNFLNAGLHRAFAIAPGGAWAWSSQQPSEADANSAALKSCRQFTEQTCVIYATDRSVSFDAQTWAGLWQLDSNEPSSSLPTGIRRGHRFPDVVYKDKEGSPHALSELRGRVVLVHFWGSWCPPCLRELPALEVFYRILRDRLPGKVELVMLQVRESFDDAQGFVAMQGWDALPLADSGARDSAHDYFDLAGGGRVADRELARVFPSTYVLDARGVVLFAHTGPVEDWSQYLPLFETAAAQSTSH